MAFRENKRKSRCRLVQAAEVSEGLYYDYGPCHHLLVAVLERAFLDLINDDHSVRTVARNWIFCNGDTKPFSFFWCLDQLQMLESLGRIHEACLELFRYGDDDKPKAEREQGRTQLFKFLVESRLRGKT